MENIYLTVAVMMVCGLLTFVVYSWENHETMETVFGTIAMSSIFTIMGCFFIDNIPTPTSFSKCYIPFSKNIYIILIIVSIVSSILTIYFGGKTFKKIKGRRWRTKDFF